MHLDIFLANMHHLLSSLNNGIAKSHFLVMTYCVDTGHTSPSAAYRDEMENAGVVGVLR